MMSATDVRAMRLFTALAEEMNSALPEADRVHMTPHKRWVTLRRQADLPAAVAGRWLSQAKPADRGEGISFGAAGTRVGARFRAVPRGRRAVRDAIRLTEAVLSAAYPSDASDLPHKLISRGADFDDRTRFHVNAAILGGAVHISWISPLDNVRTELEPLPLSLF